MFIRDDMKNSLLAASLVSVSLLSFLIVASVAFQPIGPSINSYQLNGTNNTCNRLVIVYVGHNDTCNQYTVQLTNLGQPNKTGITPAEFSIYYNNVLVNTTVLYPKQTGVFLDHGARLQLYVNQTFAGLYAYQKWAQIKVVVTYVPQAPSMVLH
jgi:hypothetical protein